MHRTTTTAAILITVAVSALSGCVTVSGPAIPGPVPDTARSHPSAPRPDGTSESRVVQAPAREALAMVGPSRHPHPTEPAPHRTPAPPPATRHPSAPPAHRPRPHPDRPRRPRAGLPDVSQPVPQTPDVCALGKKYGGWRRDSPEALICEQTYGH
ncbi:hypothetical protein ABZ471_18910 [Streptomyces sp. NPDC005728]|uniref:hypothetical protein n=1 Tax=Streptomyces sp. NPDC005728 TaxID=3157054 RepID=UPI0034030018